ncbi:MAG: iron-sulfur cluster assembly scaffold protein, partial [Pseudomonadota bacterium]|nr:iron-sulfur cluster assembly scaffold protein [Pseudomonadota bacterium]
MAEALDRVYDSLLLDHIRTARNYGLEPGAAPVCEMSNPMCGDVLQLQVRAEHDRLVAVRFSCECCGIAMGNASLMTGMVAGTVIADARALAARALGVLDGSRTDAAEGEGWALLAAIRANLPARLTCASLGWQALLA